MCRQEKKKNASKGDGKGKGKESEQLLIKVDQTTSVMTTSPEDIRLLAPAEVYGVRIEALSNSGANMELAFIPEGKTVLTAVRGDLQWLPREVVRTKFALMGAQKLFLKAKEAIAVETLLKIKEDDKASPWTDEGVLANTAAYDSVMIVLKDQSITEGVEEIMVLLKDKMAVKRMLEFSVRASSDT